MNAALMGALAGLGLAIVLMAVDYTMIKSGAAERAKRQHKKVVEFDGTEKKRLSALFRYCIFLPAAGALAFWVFS